MSSLQLKETEKMKKVLITGSYGFIGSHLCQNFLVDGWSVIGVDRPTAINLFRNQENYEFVPMDLPDPSFIDAIESRQPDLIIHAAGLSSVPFSVANPLGDFIGSVQVYYFVLDTIRRVCPKAKVIFLSSAAVYGDPSILPIDETSFTRPISPYGYHKLLCEKINDEFFNLYHLNVCSARIFSAYGPGLRKQILWDIVRKALWNEMIMLEGSGGETRDFIYITDITRAIDVIAANGEFNSESYNIASGQEINIKDLANLVAESAGHSKKIVFSGVQRSGDPLYWKADIQKLRSLGFEPKVTINSGVVQFVDWAVKDMNDNKR